MQTTNNKPKIFYGYVNVMLGFITMALLWGTVLSFGLFVKPMSAELSWSRAATSAAYSMTMFFMGLLSFVMGSLSDRFGARTIVTLGGLFLGTGLMLMSTVHSLWQLYLFFGFVVAIGVGSGFVPLASTVARWFSKRRGLMTAIVLAGFGAGNMVGPPVVNFLIAKYGWRTAYLVAGIGTMILVIIVAQFIRRGTVGQDTAQSEQINANTQTEAIPFRQYSLKEASGTGQFWLVCLINTTFGAGQMAISVHLPPYTTDLGISTYVAASVLAVMGALSIAGRISAGAATDILGARSALIISLFMTLAALVWLPITSYAWMLFIFAIIFGLGTGGAPATMSPILAELFGLKSHGAILGMTSFAWGVGAALGPIMTGYIFDSTQSYHLAFIMLAVLGAFGVILAYTLKPIGKRGLK